MLGRSAFVTGLVALFMTAESFMTAEAHAYCQTTTCSETEGECELDPETSCATTGEGLTWHRGCISYVVQESGSPLLGLTSGDLLGALDQAAATWSAADCGGHPPAIEFASLGTVSCEKAEHNRLRTR
jgi:hypothetical protein